MKLAHIVPPKVAQHVGTQLSDYNLLLPALMGNDLYRDTYRNISGYKMMDNGVAEGLPVDFKLVLNMSQTMKVDEVVLPDVVGDMDATLRSVNWAFEDAFNARKRFRFMFVLQGRNVADCIHSAEIALNQFKPIINTFGVPRHILSVDGTARLRIVRALEKIGKGRPIHLLGTYPSDPYELKFLGDEYSALLVRGVDTSLAWNVTKQEMVLGPTSLQYNSSIPRQPIEEFEKASFDHADPRYIELLRKNMEIMNSWIR